MNIFKPDETMLHNYLQNKLSPSDEEQMELWLTDHPEALEELELDLVMKEGIEQIYQDSQKHVRPIKPSDSAAFRSMHYFGAFALAVLTGLFGFMMGQLVTDSTDAISIGPNVTIVRAGQMRASVPSTIVYREDQTVLMVLELSGLDADFYQVAATTEDQSSQSTIEGLRPQGEGDLIFPLHVADLTAGLLRFTITEGGSNKHIAFIDVLIE